MSILVIDTSGASSFVAFTSQGVVVRLQMIDDSRQASMRLHETIAAVLQEERPEAIAIGIGPGSFTGTRIGAIAAQTLSFAWKIPLLTFSSLFIPDLARIAQFAYEKFQKNSRCDQLELVYISSTP